LKTAPLQRRLRRARRSDTAADLRGFERIDSYTARSTVKDSEEDPALGGLKFPNGTGRISFPIFCEHHRGDMKMVLSSKNIDTASFLAAVVWSLIIVGCSTAYYGAMEQVGVHKRDILVDRVERARDAQSEAQEQFSSALERFGSVVHIENTDLKKAYEELKDAYDGSEKAAARVSDRIDKVESVADALFQEWEGELALYKSAKLRRSSQRKLKQTQSRYREMLSSMRRAEESMEPVLRAYYDNVLFLKHNLNAQAIGSLRSEFSSLQGEIDELIREMNEAIRTSNRFISEIQS
jgi:hypothetical protein